MARNAALVLGNRRDATAVAPLARALIEDGDPIVRGAAAWALGEIGGEAAEQRLRHAAQVEQHPEVRREIAEALARPGKNAAEAADSSAEG
jgi:epoxyqueuosine reductase